MATVHERLVSNHDDFVMTLSDNEATRSNSKEPSEDAKVPKSIAQKPSQKRKRASEKRSNGAYNSTKRQKSIATGPDIVLQEESVEVTTHGEDDGAMNSDFEFQTAETGTGVIEDFDGWGIGQHLDRNGTNGDKKGVDIDELIARRRAKDPSAADSDGLIMEERNHSTKSTVKADEEPENADAWVEMMRDDELLAEDGFGMGTLNEEEEDDDGLSERDGSAKSDSDQGDDSEGSDNDSVAAAVPHPDDEVSDTSSVAEDRHDLIEKARREAFFAIEEPAANADKSSRAHKAVSFQSMSLSRPVLRGLAAVGFTIPTAIQTKAIPIALLGKDVVGGAVTGSGKTAAFLVPILERLLYRPKKVSTSRVAILMPTRELAVQCYNVAVKLAAFTDITFCCLVGGFSLREQEKELRKRPDVIMATPGRFIDHIRNSLSFTIDTLEILVLDEADRMLEDGFADELNEILTTIPKSRQTLLFSATMTDSVDKLIRVGMDRPVRLLLDARKQTVGTLVQEFVRLRPGREEKRLGYLMLLCNNVYTDRVIIFFRQKKEAHRVRIVFGLCGLKAAELHGSMTQEQRISSVELFRDGKVSFLLATDLASRGLDIKGVETVINYEAPQSHEIYLHRVGRTARAGRAGRACTIAAEPDRKVVKAAVRAGKAQGAKVLSRVVDPEEADNWAKKVNGMEEEINDILREEKEEKQLSQAEMQVKRGENIIVHESEILARPKRTWFESEKDKRAAKKAGMAELNGPEGVVGKKEKKKLSNKDKKRLDDKDMRTEGKMWKKGKADRVGKKVVTRKKGGKAAPRSFKKGKSGNR